MTSIPHTLLIAALAAVTAPGIAWADLAIDDFSAGTASVTHTEDGKKSAREGGLAGVLDGQGYREVVVRNYGAEQGSGNSAVVDAGSGILRVQRGPGPSACDTVLNDTGVEYPGVGTRDFAGPEDATAIEIAVRGNTNPTLKITVTVSKWDADFANLEAVRASTDVPAGESTATIDLAPLDLAAFGPIDEIGIAFISSPDPYDYQMTIDQAFEIGSIQAVP